MPKNITMGISPCPNDTFIFHALINGLVRPHYKNDIAIALHIADVEELNNLVLAGELAFSKVSLGVVPHILDRYMLLSSGGALGFGCGPLVVGKNETNDFDTARIASPGRMTTANLLLDLYGKFKGERAYMLFSKIMPAVIHGVADLGVIIHEGRFTYKQHGLRKILDLGEWWETNFHLPLPLGAIAVRRDVARDLALAIEDAIAISIDHAWQKPEDSHDFIRENAREMDDEVIRAHIKTFVTEYSRNLGDYGREAIRMLLSQSPALPGENPGVDIFLG